MRQKKKPRNMFFAGCLAYLLGLIVAHLVTQVRRKSTLVAPDLKDTLVQAGSSLLPNGVAPHGNTAKQKGRGKDSSNGPQSTFQGMSAKAVLKGLIERDCGMSNAKISIPSTISPEDSLAKMPVNEKQVERQPWFHTSKEGTLLLSQQVSESKSSSLRILTSLDRGYVIFPSSIRPIEFMNSFSFEKTRAALGEKFSIQADLSQVDKDFHNLVMVISSRPQSKELRKPVVLTLIIDRSIALSYDSRLVGLRNGLKKAIQQLKKGDIINVTLFDKDSCTPLENFQAGVHPKEKLLNIFEKLQPLPGGSVSEGIKEGLRIAEVTADATKLNRVLLFTHSQNSEGLKDSSLLSEVAKKYDDKKITFFGVGTGADFPEAVLEKLTDRANGATFLTGDDKQTEKVILDLFPNLLETVAAKTSFRVTLPKGWKARNAGNDLVSEKKETGFLLEMFGATQRTYLMELDRVHSESHKNDRIEVEAQFEEPWTGHRRAQTFLFPVTQILGPSTKLIQKAKYLNLYANSLGSVSAAQLSKKPDEAKRKCSSSKIALGQLSQSLMSDAEIQTLGQDFEKYCTALQSNSLKPFSQRTSP
jgi:hypothetical protein